MAINVPKKVAPVGDGAAPAAKVVTTRSKGVTTSQAPAFIRAQSALKRRAVVNIQGEEKSGKDHMALAYKGPGDLYVHSFDLGLEGVVEKFQNDKNIYVSDYELSIQPGEATDKEVGEAANKVWEQFLTNFNESISLTEKEGLVLVDTGTEAWELLRLASFGKLTQVMPHHYAKPNAEFRNIVRHSFAGTNVAWLHKMVDEWENYTDGAGKEKGRKTGRKARKGFNDIAFLVQANVETHATGVEGGSGTEFTAEILDCRLNPSVRGLVINNDFNELLGWVLGEYVQESAVEEQ